MQKLLNGMKGILFGAAALDYAQIDRLPAGALTDPARGPDGQRWAAGNPFCTGSDWSVTQRN
jgi:hypothetical protein